MTQQVRGTDGARLRAPRVFRALRTRNYRLWVSGQIVSLVGTWMQRLAQDWLVLTLSHGNVSAVGIMLAVQCLPTLALSISGGALADRYDKRRILLITQASMAACGLTLGLLDIAAAATLSEVYFVAFALGCVSAIDSPTRNAFTTEMVGEASVSNAIALNAMTTNAARIVGPALAGVLIMVLGPGWVLVLNAATFVGVLVSLLMMNTRQLFTAAPLKRERMQVREGLRYVWQRNDLRVLTGVVFLVSTFSLNFPISLAALAGLEFAGNAHAFGLLSTTLGIGTLAGATLAARRTAAPRLRTTFLGTVIAFGVVEMLTGIAPTYLLITIALIPTGALALLCTTSAMTIMQTAVPAEMRGRVMGIYTLCSLGGIPIVSPLLSWLADVLDPRVPLVLGGAISLISALAATLFLMRRTPHTPVPRNPSWIRTLGNAPIPCVRTA
ncbi:MFS transporter [Rhodococcus jostii]|uniref:MFS transporter n=1 Tax=Rhodococcus jostii TaxID=132919 RepID=UPI00363506E1